jgi:hypothetical protein
MTTKDVRIPWYEGLGKNVFIFLAGLNYFGYIHASWDSFIKAAWISFSLLLFVQVLLGVLHALKSFLEWLILRLGDE